MRSLPFLLLAGLPVLLASRAQAQTSFSIGPRVGLNVATYHFPVKPIIGTIGYRPGFEAGLAANLGRGHFALQAAALYSQKGFTQRYTADYRTSNNVSMGTVDAEFRNRLHYLTIPLSFAYTQGSDGQGAQVFAGPYLGVLLGGRYETTETPRDGSEPLTYGGAITPISGTAADFAYHAQRFDVGLQAGLGYRYRSLLLQANYSLSLRSLAVGYSYNGVTSSNPVHYNRAFQGSLTYLFGKQG
ncbi:porin family protein [Hymenobacter convexus]|uniref:porin family protein n=1 Tax=Hymenobacter sp. CA1UV-4 TaxID=3063782 RepID=UPI00271224AA|nr:porin family protein [Hymenobacter sp. CA1UV-4]MDO7852300.1 porin family protein [Hymenobacter sp. CA1UV-4]